ncbi:hypothetical protein D7Y13_24570 [Corallococcus praedator]|uniref:Uncharacterized protein n=1 Tax=Corallococcus praedator TaxID=2316724 RepID=A0ABX9QDU6_9BACT|nr:MULTISPECIES: hypothetical protein [Corallococcus]RKH15846.1 hypothetical protein D7X74_17365 [Corallococcus sp. CA047B]RKH28567.1 hypothetical protein D7X75_24540 [Corallococcus sp. CA031C]RKI02448.1 hypothetical protein D7Y13_24570 [Corallococcus praedator]
MSSNRKAVTPKQSRLPDNFTLHFQRVPGGWGVSGSSTGKGSYAYEAFCWLPTQAVAAKNPSSTAPDAKAQRGKKGGGR